MKQESRTKSIAKKKEELYQKSSSFRSALTSDINELKIDVEQWGRHILIVGGSLYVAYKLVKLLRGPRTEDLKYDNPHAVVNIKESSLIVSKIKEQIALFLLAIAVKKIKEFLNDKQND